MCTTRSCSLAALTLAASCSADALAQIERIVKPDQATTQAFALAPIADDGYATISNGFTGRREVLTLTRHTLSGAALWQRRINGPSNDRAYGIQTTRDGGFIIVGETDAFNRAQGYTTIIKTDPLGNVQWARAVPAAAYNQRPIAASVREARNGDFIVVARTRSQAAGVELGVAVRLDPLGNILFAFAYQDPRTQRGLTSFADVRVNPLFDAGFPEFTVVGYTQLDPAAPRRAVALLLDSAGNNFLAREYVFLTERESTHANGHVFIERLNPSTLRITGRHSNIDTTTDGSVIWDVDPILNPVSPFAIYDGLFIAHNAIEPSLVAPLATVIAGNMNQPGGTEDAFLGEFDAVPFAVNWSNTYGGALPDFYRGVYPRLDSVIAVGGTESHPAGPWIYTARAVGPGRTGCERPLPLPAISTFPRVQTFELPRSEIPVFEYNPLAVNVPPVQRIVCNPCPADFNEDGFLDFFDYDDYVTCYEGGPCPVGKDADFNGDGFVDFFDYDDFVAAFERGC
jgi:hypothetical protein